MRFNKKTAAGLAAFNMLAMISVSAIAWEASAASGFTLSDRIKARISSKEPARIVVGVSGTGIPVQGAAMRMGMERGCTIANEMLPTECRNIGPVNPNPAQQLLELETLLNSQQVDCLVLQPPLPSQFTGIVNKYAKLGIPVFTINIDTPEGDRLANYAIDEEQAGYSNGLKTAQIIKEKGISIDTVALGSGAPDHPWARSRMKGFEAGYRSVFPDAKFFNDHMSGLPTGKNYTNQEVLNSVTPFLMANPEVNLFFHTDQGVEGVANIIRSKGLKGKVFTSGFNVSAPILDAIDEEITLVTVDQGFENQSEAGVRACAEYLSAGKVPTDPIQRIPPIVISKLGGDGQVNVGEAKESFKSKQ